MSQHFDQTNALYAEHQLFALPVPSPDQIRNTDLVPIFLFLKHQNQHRKKIFHKHNFQHFQVFFPSFLYQTQKSFHRLQNASNISVEHNVHFLLFQPYCLAPLSKSPNLFVPTELYHCSNPCSTRKWRPS